MTWTLAGVLAASFFVAGIVKLAWPARTRHDAARWGYPVWSLRLLGVLEIIVAPMLVWPPSRLYAVAFFGMIMLGAIGTALRIRRWAEVLHPVALSVGLGVLVWYS